MIFFFQAFLLHEKEKLQEFFRAAMFWTRFPMHQFRAAIPKVQTPVQIRTERLVNPDQTKLHEMY